MKADDRHSVVFLDCGCITWRERGDESLHMEPCGEIHARAMQRAARRWARRMEAAIEYDDGTSELPPTFN